MLESDLQVSKVAADLMDQFIKDGCVQQENDGTFTVNDRTGSKKFKYNAEEYWFSFEKLFKEIVNTKI